MAMTARTPLLNRLPDWQLQDRQYVALLFLADSELLRGRMDGYIEWEHGRCVGVMKDELLAAIGVWSHGEQVVAKIALDMFDPGCVEERGHSNPGFGEIADLLSWHNLEAVLKALAILRGQSIPAMTGKLA